MADRMLLYASVFDGAIVWPVCCSQKGVGLSFFLCRRCSLAVGGPMALGLGFYAAGPSLFVMAARLQLH